MKALTAGLFIIVIIMTLFLASCGESAANFAQNRAVNTMANAISQTQAIQRTLITNSQFPVQARNYKYFEFTVDTPSIVSGGFRAYGGSNDIDAILVDEANYTFVVNGMQARTYLHTGYTERGKPDIRIPAGHFYLIFDNRKSILTDKSVAAEFYVEPQ